MARQQEMTIMTRLGKHTIDPEKVIRFPRGLIGFEDRQTFTLLQITPGSPFLVLQSMDDPGLGLLVADPYAFIPNYRVHVGNAEQGVLEAASREDVAVLVTVSIPHGKPEETTLNLTGPVLINYGKRLGLQVPQPDNKLPARWRIRQDEKDVASEERGQEGRTEKSEISSSQDMAGCEEGAESHDISTE